MFDGAAFRFELIKSFFTESRRYFQFYEVGKGYAASVLVS